MGTPPDEIRSDIDQTRAELSRDVDRLADRTNPRRTAQRGAEQVRRTARRLSGRAGGTDSETVRPVGESTGDAEEAAPERAALPDRGNPVVVGLLAFGAGLLTASAFRWATRGRASKSRPVRRLSWSGGCSWTLSGASREMRGGRSDKGSRNRLVKRAIRGGASRGGRYATRRVTAAVREPARSRHPHARRQRPGP